MFGRRGLELTLLFLCSGLSSSSEVSKHRKNEVFPALRNCISKYQKDKTLGNSDSNYVPNFIQ